MRATGILRAAIKLLQASRMARRETEAEGAEAETEAGWPDGVMFSRKKALCAAESNYETV